MIERMFNFILKPLSFMSLAKIHALGKLVGTLMYFIMPQTVHLIHENFKQSGIKLRNKDSKKFIKENLQELGKSVFESFSIWLKPKKEVLSWVKSSTNWDVIEKALSKGKGIIFLTPHMGCFEITSLYYAKFHPITVLFRKPKRKWLHALTTKGRSNSQVKLAPANSSGVRMLLQALKNGEAIGILPDQIPGKGEGEWAPFFGKPAYTMTLASKLANKTGATVIMAYGERLADGEGFEIHLTELPQGAIATPELLNKAIERQIAQNPTQYLWSYPRYKVRSRLIKRQQETHS